MGEKERCRAQVPSTADLPDERLREVYELSILYDFYGELLGGHKKKIFEDYVLNDLSLAEIADEAGISRQGVHDAVRRCSRALREYEEKLRLVQRFDRAKKHIADIRQISEEAVRTGSLERVREIAGLSEQLLKEL